MNGMRYEWMEGLYGMMLLLACVVSMIVAYGIIYT